MADLVEYHPTSGLPMAEAGGAWRVMGCLPPHARTALPAWSDGRPSAEAGQYVERDVRADWPTVPVADQGQTESCVGHATEAVFSYSWLQGGLAPKLFSPTFVYGIINGGRDAGAVISDAMTVIKMYGIAESSFVPEGMIFRKDFPAAAFDNARRYRAVEVYQCRTFADICDAISKGFVVISGISVGQNFCDGDLDSDGVAPLPDRVVGGHALPHVGLKWSKARQEWIVLTQNSWGERWGMADSNGVGGFCYLREAHWGTMSIDAWAVVGVINDPTSLADAIPVAR